MSDYISLELPEHPNLEKQKIPVSCPKNNRWYLLKFKNNLSQHIVLKIEEDSGFVASLFVNCEQTCKIVGDYYWTITYYELISWFKLPHPDEVECSVCVRNLKKFSFHGKYVKMTFNSDEKIANDLPEEIREFCGKHRSLDYHPKKAARRKPVLPHNY